MKVIKRDGRAVDYNSEKIRIAIEKANNEVAPEERATKEEVDTIIEYIQSINKKRILVEDIQDIIEQKLMELQRYNLAKKYVVYRYTRTLVRKQSITDEYILGMIKNINSFSAEGKEKYISIPAQRNLIAGEVSKDLTRRILIPKTVSKANDEGIINFHNTEYFLQPMINSCLVNIQDMLDNGTVIYGTKVDSPKDIYTACFILSQIITEIANNQYGTQYIKIASLGKYYKKSYEIENFTKLLKENIEEIDENIKKYINENTKENIIENVGQNTKENISESKKLNLNEYIKDNINESTKQSSKPEIKANDLERQIIQKIAFAQAKKELTNGIKAIQYSIKMLTTIFDKFPLVTFIVELNDEDEFFKENLEIAKQLLNMKIEENEKYIASSFDFICNLKIKDTNTLNEIKKLAQQAGADINSKIAEKYKYDGFFNQGKVSINLIKIATDAEKNEKKFWNLLEERLEICYEALMCKHYALLGTQSDVSPILWQGGAIARLQKGESIDKLLKDGYSSISLGVHGMYDASIMLFESEEDNTLKKFSERLMKYLEETIQKWRKMTGLGFEVVQEDVEEH